MLRFPVLAAMLPFVSAAAAQSLPEGSVPPCPSALRSQPHLRRVTGTWEVPAQLPWAWASISRTVQWTRVSEAS